MGNNDMLVATFLNLYKNFHSIPSTTLLLPLIEISIRKLLARFDYLVWCIGPMHCAKWYLADIYWTLEQLMYNINVSYDLFAHPLPVSFLPLILHQWQSEWHVSFDKL